MNIVDAFLIATIVSYMVGVFYPRILTSIGNIFVEKLCFLALGLLISGDLAVNISALWIVTGALLCVLAVTDYMGDFRWLIHMGSEAPKGESGYKSTNEAQCFMTGWDLLIATSCFTKV